MVPLFIKLNLVPGSIVQKLKRVDWMGNVIFVASTTSFLIPLTWGGVQYPWNSWHTLVPLLIGLAGFASFCVFEVAVPAEPTVRFSIIRSYNMAFSLFGAVIHAILVYGVLYFMPLYFEAVKGLNPTLAGVALFPVTFTVSPMSIISGLIVTKTGDFRGVIWFGWVATTLGSGVLILLDVDTTTAQWIFLNLCLGIGLGFLYSALNLINQTAAMDSDMAFAVSFFTFSRSLGQCIGVAICGVIFQNQMKQRLLEIPLLMDKAVEYSKDASGLVQTLKSMPDSETKQDLVHAYADSLKIVWAVMCALSGVAMLLSFFIRRQSLDRALATEQGLEGDRKAKTNNV